MPFDPRPMPRTAFFDAGGYPINATENAALRISLDNLAFFDQVDGTQINTNSWLTSVSTMAAAQASGFIFLNSGASVASGGYAILQSIKAVPLYAHEPMEFSYNAIVTPATNTVIELGCGTATTTTAPTDGVFFRWTASLLQCVLNNAGTETKLTVNPSLIPGTTGTNLFVVVLVEDGALFFINDVLVGELDIPSGQGYPTDGGRQKLLARVYTTGVAGTAPALKIGQCSAIQQVINQNKLWQAFLAGIGRGAYQSPVTAFLQTANHANSTSPVSATLANATAGYTTLGGRYQFAAPASAATDFALFGFQVPAGYQLYVSSVAIAAMNTGATVATTPTVLDWSVAVNSSSVDLGTAESPPATYAPRRSALGMHGFQVGALAGAQAPDLVRTFDPPLVVDGGRFFHTIVQVPVGTATASQVVRGDVLVNGYFE
jgi:hypothetical protein